MGWDELPGAPPGVGEASLPDTPPAGRVETLSQREQRIAAMDLFYATVEGSADKVQALLASSVDPNCRDYENRTALHIAAGTGKSMSVIQSLLKFKANVNVLDSWGQTPLEQSQRAGHPKVEQLLKNHGARPQKAMMQKRAAREKWEISRDDVQLGKELSRTLKSVVHRATWNGVEVVAKFCLPEAPEGMSAEEMEQEMFHEIAILGSVRHPDLVMFLGCCLQDSPMMFITEFMPGGDLETYYMKKADDAGSRWAANFRTVNRWGRDVLRALAFLHGCTQPIIHRDLKPLNLLLTQDKYSVKVADFGISKITHRHVVPTPLATPDKAYTQRISIDGADRPSMVSPSKCSMGDAHGLGQKGIGAYTMTGGVGSWRYMAPEVARHEPYTEKVDIFAWGLILYFMSSGRQPFHTYKDPVNILMEYSSGLEPRPKVVESNSAFRPIMSDAWAVNPKERPSAQILIERLVECNGNGNNCTCTAM